MGIRTNAINAASAEIIDGTTNWRGMCLKFVRTTLGIPSRDPSAIVAWRRTHPADRHGGKTPPPGVPVFWKVGQYGHVALSAGRGRVYSTDIVRSGRVDLVAIDTITKRWGAEYLGWTETLNGQRVISNRAAAIEP